ncbi:hypothetical protein ACTXT7_010542 [Hymenolepis weldensis]
MDKNNSRESFNAVKTTLKEVEAPRRARARFGLRVNADANADADADADAHVKTLQTIVKPPWIDSIGNGGRSSCLCQQDSAPSYKVLNIHQWMAENFHYHVTSNL